MNAGLRRKKRMRGRDIRQGVDERGSEATAVAVRGGGEGGGGGVREGGGEEEGSGVGVGRGGWGEGEGWRGGMVERRGLREDGVVMGGWGGRAEGGSLPIEGGRPS